MNSKSHLSIFNLFKKNFILPFLIVAFLVFASGTPYLHSSIIKIAVLFIFFVSTLLFTMNLSKNAFIFPIILLIGSSPYIFIYGYESQNDLITLINIILTVFLVASIVETIGYHKFIFIFQKISFILSFISVILSILIFLDIISWYSFPVYVDSVSGRQYANLPFLLFETMQTYYRNYSIFREPGLLSCLLIFTLITSLSVENYLNKFQIIIIWIAGLLTGSTTFFIFTILYMIYYISDNTSSYLKILLFLVSPLILYFIFFGDFILDNQALSRKLVLENYSVYIRYLSLSKNFEIMFLYPLGTGESEYLFLMDKLTGGRLLGSMNTLYYGCVYGISFFLSIFYISIAPFFNGDSSIYVKVLAITSVILIIFSQVLVLFPLYAGISYAAYRININKNSKRYLTK